MAPVPGEPIYEVLLDSVSPESLRSRFPHLAVQVTGAQTVLRPRGSGPVQLEEFLERLSLLGLQLEEVHRLPDVVGEDCRYEVRVEGEIRPALLSRLGGSHGVFSDRPRVRIMAVAAVLHQILQTCTECGARIHRVRLRSAPNWAVAELGCQSLRGAPIADRGARRRPVG